MTPQVLVRKVTRKVYSMTPEVLVRKVTRNVYSMTPEVLVLGRYLEKYIQ